MTPSSPANPSDRKNRSENSIEISDSLRTYADLRRRSFGPDPPPALKNFAFAVSAPTTTVHAACDDKLDFEGMRSRLRSVVGFPVTQPGAFALVVAFASAHEDAFLRFAVSQLKT